MPVHSLNHFTVFTRDLDASLHFYAEVLGLKVGPRPELPSKGAWLYLGDQAVLHVIVELEQPTSRYGVIDHVALTATDLRAMTERLRSYGVKYDLMRQPGSGTWQLFLIDPNGGLIELIFDAKESQ